MAEEFKDKDTETYSIEYNTKCTDVESGSCHQLMTMKDDIFKVNNDHYANIVAFTGYVGDYERKPYDIIFDYSAFRSTYTNIEFIKSIRAINSKLYLEHEYSENKSILTRKQVIGKDASQKNIIKKQNYTILESKLFFTGNLSPTLIIEYLFAQSGPTATTENKMTLYNTVAKIYPIDLAELDNTYASTIDEKKKFKNYMQYLFYREGLIGCWIKHNIIFRKISSTFACVFDAYLLKGLPMSKESFTHQLLMDSLNVPKKIKKKWVNKLAMVDWDDNTTKLLYGYIEMEKIDCTLESLMHVKREYFNLGSLFEIFYSKLVLAFVGNIYMCDDHANNIMMKYTNYVRHYQITRRNTVYNFYIDTPYMIKFIDFERFNKIIDRNLLWEDNDKDTFIKYFNRSYNYYFTKDEISIANQIIKIVEKQKNRTVDNFCELMVRCLPERYTNPALYTSKKIETYSVNLDTPHEELKENFITAAVSTDTPIHIPHRLLVSSTSGAASGSYGAGAPSGIFGGGKNKLKIISLKNLNF